MVSSLSMSTFWNLKKKTQVNFLLASSILIRLLRNTGATLIRKTGLFSSMLATHNS